MKKKKGTSFDIEFFIDFDPNLKELIVEIKQLDAMGFEIPDLARNFALNVCFFFLKI